MLTLRNSSVFLNIYSHTVRRGSSCWRLLLSDTPECRSRVSLAMRRSFCHSSVISEGAENTEDAVPKEVAEMRSQMSQLHRVVSSKGVSLADYKRTSNEGEAQDDCNLTSLQEVNSENDYSEDSFDQTRASLDDLGKGLRQEKDVDVVINMPYGYVRFDSMNRQKSALQHMSEEPNVAVDDIPSVKVIKDGQHVFSLTAVKENEADLEHASEDIARDEICHEGSQRESEIHNVKSNLFDEQYFDDILQQEEIQQENMTKNVAANGKLHNRKPNYFDEQYFSEVLHYEEQKQTSGQQEKDKQRNITKNAITNSEICDVKADLFDKQYFGKVQQHKEQKQMDIKTISGKMTPTATKNTETVDLNPNIFDEQYFGSYTQSKLTPLQKGQGDDIGKGDLENSDQSSHSYQDHHHSLEADSSNILKQYSTPEKMSESISTASSRRAPVLKETESIYQDSVTTDDSTVVVEPITPREMKSRTRPKPDVENPKTAYDMMMKIRQDQRQRHSTSSDTDKKQQAFGMN